MTIKNKKVLALIPARGGSKSVPRKNIIQLGGKPMIAWAIETAKASKYIDRVIVTTDCSEIKSVALEYGAEVPFLRPSEISGDYATDYEFHAHAINWLMENEDYRPDFVLNLRPTPPARKVETIDLAIEQFDKHPEVDSLRSVHLASETPFKMWRVGDDGLLSQVAFLEGVDEPYNQPRQKLPMIYWQDGYVDITRPSVIIEKKSTTGKSILPFEINEPAFDVDYPDDLINAEAQLVTRKGDGESSVDLAKIISMDDKRYPS